MLFLNNIPRFFYVMISAVTYFTRRKLMGYL